MLFKTDYKNKLVKIFVPLMLSQLISQIQMFIDRIFLGRMDILYMSAVGEKDIEKSKDYAASLIKFHNVIPLLLFLFWTFCSPLVFRLMDVSENVMKPCVTYSRLYAPVYLIIGLGASYSVVFQTSNFTKPLVAYGILRSVLNIILDYLLIFGNFGFPRLTLSLFTTDKEVIEMSVIYIILVAANLFGKSGNIIIGNGIRGYGDTKWILFTQILGTIGVVSLAAICVFVLKLGMLGVFIAVLCDEALRAVINFIRFLKIKF